MTAARTVYLETMGCQMNALDSELVLGDLTAQGYRPTDDPAAAHLVILNTCSVRQHAEDKVYSRLGQLRGAKTRHGQRIVAVIGCMAERDGEGLLAKGGVDILCGPNDLHRLPGLIAQALEDRRPAVALSGRLRDRSTPTHRLIAGATAHDDLESLDSGRFFGLSGHVPTPKVFGRHQAYVRITRGCNKYCTFCVVPYVRGPEVHRPPNTIVDEMRRLADAGVKEVTLLGQTVNHYRYRGDGEGGTAAPGGGKGLGFRGWALGASCPRPSPLAPRPLSSAAPGGDGQGGETTFAQLLRRVHDEVPQLPRLRFVTSYPRDFDDETLRVMAESPRICRYLHVPAQSGSDAVLQRMNRGYTVEQYTALLDRARAVMPDISIAGDMIVGFCGETEPDFERSLELLRCARYKNCFVFKYSPRPGTAADARLPDDVPDEVKRRRNNDMLAVQAEINLANHRAMLGQIVEVLVEGPSKSALKAQESEQERGEAATKEPAALAAGLPPSGALAAGTRIPVRHRLIAGESARIVAGTRIPSRSNAGKFRDQLVGRTRGDQIVVLDGPPELIGRLTPVRITAATPYTLHGECAASDRGPGTSGEAGIALPVVD
jgi:tRNA-2-methylthio-N6-dimethylallyladenosine synthase